MQEEVQDTIIMDKKEETRDFLLLYPRFCASLEFEASSTLTLRVGNIKKHMKETISRMGEEKEREDRWKNIHVMDHQLYAKRAYL